MTQITASMVTFDCSDAVALARWWAGITAGPIEFDTVTGQPGSARGSTAGAIAWDEMLTQRDWDMWSALGPPSPRSAARSCS